MERTFNDFIEELKQLAARGERNQERIQGALTLLESIEWTKQRHPKLEPPQPAPTPDAPDPGRGWRLKKRGEMITRGDQSLCCGEWGETVLREPVMLATIRTPIYHNPANLETAGEGYRFCLVSETEEPGVTEWWNDEAKSWRVGSQGGGMHLHNKLTYRTQKPLPTT